MDVIQSAMARGQKALSEYQSKKLLSQFGIPVTREELVQTAEAAVAAAGRIGFPVALKACSAQLLHKSETGGIALHLSGPDAVGRAFAEIRQKVRVPLEGLLVQEMVAGQREIVVGLSREPQFGPCVMLGLGGVMAEVLQDTVFRVAPIDALEARDMIDELKSRALLDAFRGQNPADLEAIGRILMAAGRIGLEQPAVAEIDINPVIVTPAGALVAVDALVVLEGKQR